MQPSRAIDLVTQLMAIPGPSCQEGQVAQWVVERLREAGLGADQIQFDTAHKRTPTPGEVGNLIVQLPGTTRGPRRMLSAHLDTVPICVGSQPRRRGGEIRSSAGGGVGADNRAGCAVVLATVLDILEHQLPHPPLTACWFVQEEIGLQGSRCVSRALLGRPRCAFNWDGGAPEKLTVGATGGVRMEITVRGLASHAGAAPQRGVSAVSIAALAIADLQRGGWHGLIHRDEGHGTSNVGVIQGGAATNVVTDKVWLRAEARSHEPDFRRRIVQEIRDAFERAAREVVNDEGRPGSVEIQERLDYESFLLADDEPCVTWAEEAVRSVGRAPLRAVSNGGVDANWTTRHGIPTVTLGCGQRGAHTADESLVVEEYLDATRIALRLACADELASADKPATPAAAGKSRGGARRGTR